MHQSPLVLTLGRTWIKEQEIKRGTRGGQAVVTPSAGLFRVSLTRPAHLGRRQPQKRDTEYSRPKSESTRRLERARERRGRKERKASRS